MSAQQFELGRILVKLGETLQRTVVVPGHSEENEDELLRELLPFPDGCYVSVGEHYPTCGSTTWNLYRRGWRGLLIEPLPEMWYPILSQRMGDYLVPCAVARENGYALMRLAGPCSTLDPTWPVETSNTMTVMTRPLRDILHAFPDIRRRCDLCCVDVEGLEPEVLASIDFQTFRPSVFLVEAMEYAPLNPDGTIPPRRERWPDWEPILLEQGYRFHGQSTTGVNRLYVHQDYRGARK